MIVSFSGRVEDRVDNQVRCAPARRFRTGVFSRQDLELPCPHRVPGVEKRLVAARGQGDVAPSVQPELFPRQASPLGRPVDDRRHRADVEFGGLQREREGESVVDIVADVGVEQDRDRSSLGGRQPACERE